MAESCRIWWWSTPKRRNRKTRPYWYPSSDAAGTPKEWLAAQVPLWFGETHRCKTPNEVEDPLWRCKLADLLRGHFAFHNLLKDLERLASRSVPVEQVLQTLTSRLPAGSSSRFASLWLGSLLALVVHARTARGGNPSAREMTGKGEGSQSAVATGKTIETTFFLQVKVEIWLRELRRMVASLDSASPELKHHDDIHGKQDDRLWAPVLSCRDCHVTGWGATISHADENVLITDPQTFYNAYFGESLSTRMIFPLSALRAGKSDAGDSPTVSCPQAMPILWHVASQGCNDMWVHGRCVCHAGGAGYQ